MNKERTTLQKVPLFGWVAFALLLLIAVGLWRERNERRLTGAINHKLRLTVADSVARAADKRRQRAVDSVRNLYEVKLAAQVARYEEQRKADAKLEVTYRRTGADLVLPDYQ